MELRSVTIAVVIGVLTLTASGCSLLTMGIETGARDQSASRIVRPATSPGSLHTTSSRPTRPSVSTPKAERGFTAQQHLLILRLRLQSFLYRHGHHTPVLVNHDQYYHSCEWLMSDGSLAFGNCTAPDHEIGCGG